MELRRILRLGENPAIAITGSGGKTTLAFSIAREYENAFVTTTTHIGDWQLSHAKNVLFVDNINQLSRQELNKINGITLFLSPSPSNNKYRGLEDDYLYRLAVNAKLLNIPLIIEADGAKGKSLKAHNQLEPVIPSFTDVVIVVAGLSGIGEKLSEKVVHRADIFSSISGVLLGGEIRTSNLFDYLTHPSGGKKGIRRNMVPRLLLSQGDDYPEEIPRETILNLLTFYSSVTTADLMEGITNIQRHDESISGIILAAGDSTRFPGNKLLSKIEGETIIHRVGREAENSDLSEIIVIVGEEIHNITEELKNTSASIIMNPSWFDGQSTSLIAGLREVSLTTQGVMFLLGDQPLITADFINNLISKHSEYSARITAPQINGQQGNPVIIDKSLFRELFQLRGDVGAKSILNTTDVNWVCIEDKASQLDIDTPHDLSIVQEHIQNG